MLSGCAVQFRDGSGTTHIIGLAHVEVRGTTSGRSEVIAQQVSTIGAALLFLPEHSGIALGYSRNFTLEINSTDGAGELSLPLRSPTEFTFTDLHEITRERR